VIGGGDADGSGWCCGLRWSPAAWRARWGGSDGCEAAGAGHVVSQGIPDGHDLDLVDAAHREAGKRSIAGLGVERFRGCRPLLVDRLCRHALSPLGHRRGVVGPRLVAVTGLVVRHGHRHEGLDAGQGQRRDVVEPGEAAIGQIPARPPAERLGRRSSAPSCPRSSRCCRAPRRPLPRSWCRRQTARCRPVGRRHRPSSSAPARPSLPLGVQRLGERQGLAQHGQPRHPRLQQRGEAVYQQAASNAGWPTRKFDSVLRFMPIPPHSH
jgi:hypothetical protein